MSLIQCEEDNSYCIVEDAGVVFDDNVAKNGDVVCFFWKSKQHTGRIIKRSENGQFLKEEMKRLKKEDQTLKKSSSPSTAIISSKRKHVENKRWSPEQTKRTRSMKMDSEQKNKSQSGENEKVDLKTGSKSGCETKKEKAKSQSSKNIIGTKNERTVSRLSSSSSEQSSSSDEDSSSKGNESGNPPKTSIVPLHNSPSTSSTQSEVIRSPTKDELEAIAMKYDELIANKNKKKSKMIDTTQSSSKSSRNQSCDVSKTSDTVASVNKDEDETKTSTQTKDSSDDEESEEVSEEHTDGKCVDCSDQVPNEEELDKDQLSGRDFEGRKMIHLENGIYCIKKIHLLALGSSHRATHVARKLLEGVFKHEALMQCTVSGQTPRAQGKDRQKENVSCLHEVAKNTIIEFSRRIAEKKEWKKQSRNEIRRAISQKLGEYKREVRNAEKQRSNDSNIDK